MTGFFIFLKNKTNFKFNKNKIIKNKYETFCKDKILQFEKNIKTNHYRNFQEFLEEFNKFKAEFEVKRL